MKMDVVAQVGLDDKNIAATSVSPFCLGVHKTGKEKRT